MKRLSTLLSKAFISIIHIVCSIKPFKYIIVNFKISKKRFIKYNNNYVSQPFQFKQLYLVFIFTPIVSIISSFYSYGEQYRKGL